MIIIKEKDHDQDHVQDQEEEMLNEFIVKFYLKTNKNKCFFFLSSISINLIYHNRERDKLSVDLLKAVSTEHGKESLLMFACE